MKTVIDILSALEAEIQQTHGRLASLQSFRSRIAHANGLAEVAADAKGGGEKPQAQSPKRQAPATDAPATDSPTTTYRPTAAPATRAPDTDAPATDEQANGRQGRRPDPAHVAGVGKLPEPFTRQAVAVALGFPDAQQASGLLTRMKDRGWLTSAARGEWHKTNTFGQ